MISAGMARSASTWLYNAVRLILGGYPVVSEKLWCGWLGDCGTMPKREYVLIKMHEFDQVAVQLSSAIFYSFRDIRGAIASQQRKFGGTPDITWAEMYIQLHELWMQKADFTMKYETMLQDRERIIAAIAQTIRDKKLVPHCASYTPPDPARICAELDQLSYESAGEKTDQYHKINLYHRGHITDGRIGAWKRTLDPDLAARITEEYRWWFEKYGYPTELAPRAGLEPATR